MYSNSIDMFKIAEESKKLQKNILKNIGFLSNIAKEKDDSIGSTPKELVYEQDKIKLYHYIPKVKNPCKVPLLMVYALVNRQYMVDLQPDRSLVKNMLEQGLDVYIIDWGYPKPEDMFLTMDDYINGYVNDVVDFILDKHKLNKINLLGICQGGTFSTIYSAQHPEKVKNLITMVTPIDFETNDGLLFRWSKDIDMDLMVDTFGLVPGGLMNDSYKLLNPFYLSYNKYISIVDNIKDIDDMKNFIRMERWIADAPDQAGEVIRQFINDLYRDNKLVKGELVVGGEKVDLKKIDMPLLNIYAEKDTLVPNAATIPLNDLISSKDKEYFSLPVGHIGMYTSSKSQSALAPKIAEWLKSRSKK